MSDFDDLLAKVPEIIREERLADADGLFDEAQRRLGIETPGPLTAELLPRWVAAIDTVRGVRRMQNNPPSGSFIWVSNPTE